MEPTPVLPAPKPSDVLEDLDTKALAVDVVRRLWMLARRGAKARRGRLVNAALFDDLTNKFAESLATELKALSARNGWG